MTTPPSLPEPNAAKRKIVTDHVYPPIPIRSFDWVAYFDGDEESGPRGWGTTKEIAIEELRQSVGDYCRLCKRENAVSCHMGGCPVGADL